MTLSTALHTITRERIKHQVQVEGLSQEAAADDAIGFAEWWITGTTTGFVEFVEWVPVRGQNTQVELEVATRGPVVRGGRHEQGRLL